MADEQTKPSGAAPFSFDNFTTPEKQEEGHEVHIRLPDGSKSGLVIRIAGPDSKRRKRVSQEAMDSRLKAGKGRGVKMTAAELESSNLDEMVAATISWQFPDGFDGPPCTPDEVRKIYLRHTDIYQQVFDAGNDLANFTQRSQTT